MKHICQIQVWQSPFITPGTDGSSIPFFFQSPQIALLEYSSSAGWLPIWVHGVCLTPNCRTSLESIASYLLSYFLGSSNLFAVSNDCLSLFMSVWSVCLCSVSCASNFLKSVNSKTIVWGVFLLASATRHHGQWGWG